MGWYTKPGDENAEKFKQDQNHGSVWKFSVKPGEKKKVLFLADEKIGVWEHRIQAISKNGIKIWEQITCPRDATCYHCAMGGDMAYSSYSEYSTVLELTPYTDKNGVQKKFSRKAFRATGTAIEILNRKRQLKAQKNEKDGTFVLTGYIVECFRDGEKTPACGNDFEVQGEKQDLSKVPPDVKPIDFEKMLAPLPTHVIQGRMALHNSNPPVQKRSDLQPGPLAGSPENEDIPF